MQRSVLPRVKEVPKKPPTVPKEFNFSKSSSSSTLLSRENAENQSHRLNSISYKSAPLGKSSNVSSNMRKPVITEEFRSSLSSLQSILSGRGISETTECTGRKTNILALGRGKTDQLQTTVDIGRKSLGPPLRPKLMNETGASQKSV